VGCYQTRRAKLGWGGVGVGAVVVVVVVVEGGLPRGMRSADAPRPSADPRRWRTTGGPVAGAQSAKAVVSHGGSMIPHVSCIYQQVSGYILAGTTWVVVGSPPMAYSKGAPALPLLGLLVSLRRMYQVRVFRRGTDFPVSALCCSQFNGGARSSILRY
jgi:hypothetical protein